MKRLLLILCLASAAFGAGPDHVDITWFSISNMYYELGSTNVITDGYISRIPQSAFFGGGGGLANTRKGYKPDEKGVARVLQALGGKKKVNLLLTGHSHFDHSFDTATWSRLTGAKVIGSKTTCLQTQAEKIPEKRCTAVYGGEKIKLADGVTMRVIRWNHSGDSVANPEQHTPVELTSVPRADAEGLHAGVAEDFPNGGGNRAFLFTVDGPGGRYSWFFHNSGSASDLESPIIVDGKNYGAPLENLKAAMKESGLEAVDLWIGTGGSAIARLVLPVVRPKAYLPVHWDGLYGAFEAGVPRAYRDAPLEQLLKDGGITLVRPQQYMDKWRLDVSGVRAIPNVEVKRALGF
ncbi:MAG: MBL fold metallo-hydrolase [Acidobacteriota bacterium]